MRLHALIFSVMNQVPAVGIAYDPKVGIFLSQLRLPFFTLEQYNHRELSEQAIKLHQERKLYQRFMKEKLIELKQASGENFRAALDLLK